MRQFAEVSRAGERRESRIKLVAFGGAVMAACLAVVSGRPEFLVAVVAATFAFWLVQRYSKHWATKSEAWLVKHQRTVSAGLFSIFVLLLAAIATVKLSP